MPVTSVGRVVGTSMQKTAKVQVVRAILNPRLNKFFKRKNNVFAHDEESKCQVGDLVRVVESPRISKIKHFKILEILEKGGTKVLSNTGKAVYQFD